MQFVFVLYGTQHTHPQVKITNIKSKADPIITANKNVKTGIAGCMAAA